MRNMGNDIINDYESYERDSHYNCGVDVHWEDPLVGEDSIHHQVTSLLGVNRELISFDFCQRIRSMVINAFREGTRWFYYNLCCERIESLYMQRNEWLFLYMEEHIRVTHFQNMSLTHEVYVEDTGSVFRDGNIRLEEVGSVEPQQKVSFESSDVETRVQQRGRKGPGGRQHSRSMVDLLLEEAMGGDELIILLRTYFRRRIRITYSAFVSKLSPLMRMKLPQKNIIIGFLMNLCAGGKLNSRRKRGTWVFWFK